MVKSKNRRLKKFIFTSISFVISPLLIIYLFFPYLSGWAISLFLPTNIKMTSFTSQYPSLKSTTISNANFEVDNLFLHFEGVNIDHKLSNIEAKAIQIEVRDTQDDNLVVNQHPINLPFVDFQSFVKLQGYESIKIDNLVVNFSNQVIDITDILLDKIKPTVFKIRLVTTEPIQQTKIKLTATIELNADNQSVSIVVNQLIGKDILKKRDQANNIHEVAMISLQQSQQPRILKAKLNVEMLIHWLAKLYPEFNVEPTEDIIIEWLQNDTNKTAHLSVQGNLGKRLNREEKSNLSKTENNQLFRAGFSNSNLKSSINLTFESDLSQKLGIIGLHARLKSTNRLDWVSNQASISLSDLNVLLESNLLFSEKEKSTSQFRFTENRLSIKSDKGRISMPKKKLSLELGNIDLSLRLDKLTTNLTDSIVYDGLVKGVVTLPSIKGKYSPSLSDENGQSIVLDQASIQGEFELAKQNRITSNGQLIVSDVAISDSNAQTEVQIKIDWHDVERNLSSGEITTEITGKNKQLHEYGVKDLDSQFELSLTPEKIIGKGDISINKEAVTPFSIIYDKESTAWTINLAKEELDNQLFNQILELIGKQNKTVLKIIEGKVNHSGKLKFNQNILVKSRLAVKDMLFQFGENTVSGMNISQELTSLSPLDFKTELTIEKIEFASGLNISNFHSQIKPSKNNVFDVSSLRADLLEGQLQADTLKFSPSGLLETPIKLTKLSLMELFFFLDIAGLYGEGLLNFNLPLSTQQGSLVIKDGHFKAIDKGLIKYSTADIDSGVEENIAMQALRNFHYDSLEGDISYSQNGDYKIKIHLLGSNPELYDGYPIDFILNLQGKLTDIFRSLFLTGSFEEAVLRQVKLEQINSKQNNIEKSNPKLLNH